MITEAIGNQLRLENGNVKFRHGLKTGPETIFNLIKGFLRINKISYFTL